MTQEQILSLVRAILAALGGFFVAKGTISADTLTWIIGGVATIVPVVWGWLTNRPASLAAKAQALQGVTVNTDITATPAVTAAVANAKSG